MNTSKLADIAEITSSIAILATLVFLVIQTQQNTAAIQANGRQAALDQELEYLYKNVENPNLNLARFKAELTQEEQVQLGYQLTAYFRMREHDWYQYQNGVLDESAWDSYRGPIALSLSSKRARNWWRDVSSAFYDPSFVAEVNDTIAAIPLDENAIKTIWFDG